MSDITATVIPGYVLSPDASGKVWLTYVRLNQLGVPTVTVSTTGIIAAADLSTALAAKIISPDITVGAEASDAIPVTIQIQNAVGSDITGYHAFRYWLSDTEFGGETGTAPAGDLTLTTGVVLEEITADKQQYVLTDSDGVAVIDVDNTGGSTDSWYLMVELQGIVTASAIITITI